jgi:hypothetical protein
VTGIRPRRITETLRDLVPDAPATARTLAPGEFEVLLPADAADQLGIHPPASHCWPAGSVLTRRLGVTVEITAVRYTRRSRARPGRPRLACITLTAAGGR